MHRAFTLIPSIVLLGPLMPILVAAFVFAALRSKGPSGTTDDIQEGTRETQIIRFAALGLTDKEIAEKLNLSPNTIYTYWRRVRARYGSNSRGEAISRYLHDSFNHFRRIVDLFPDTILIIQHSRICFASPAASTLFNLEPNESPIEQPIDRFLVTDTLPMSDDRNLRFGTARTTGRQVQVLRKDGDNVDAILSCTPIEWQGRAASLTVVREQSADLDLRGSIENSVSESGTLPDILLMIDQRGICLDYRPGHRAPVVHKAVGKSYQEILPPPVAFAIDEAMRRLKTRPTEVHVNTGGTEIGRFVARCSVLADNQVLVLVRFVS